MHLTMNVTQSRPGEGESARAHNKNHLDQRQHQYYPYIPRITTHPPAKPAKPAMSGKSKPVDPNDLRRRLLVVVAERDAIKEKRRRALAAQQEAEAARKQEVEVKRAKETNVLAAIRPKSRKPFSSNPGGYKDASGISSSSSKLARKVLDLEAGTERNSYANQATKGSPRPQAPYVPQEAAAQFSETTTSDTMQNPSTLSLRRSLSNREPLNESPIRKNRHHTQRGPKDSMGGLAGIREDGQQRRRRSSLGYSPGSNGPDQYLAAPQRLQTAPQDYRMVDWSQSDEIRAQGDTQTTVMLAKRRSSFFLRKAESVWALRGKLVGKSGSGGGGREDDGHVHNHRKTPSAASEGGVDEKTHNAKNQEPTSPLSPRSRLGFITKLKH